MDNASLDILIRTLADTHGADQVAASLAKVDASGKTAAASTKELGSNQESLTQYQKDSAVPVLAAQAEKTEALKGASEHAAEGHGLHRLAARQLHEEFGILGRVLHTTLGQFTIPLAGIIAGWTLWKKRVDELVSAMTSVEIPDLSGHIGALKASETAWGEYAEKVGEANKKLHEADAWADARLKRLAAEVTLMKELLAAQKAEELARAKNEEEKAKIEAKFSAKEKDADKFHRDQEFDIKRRQAAALAKEASEAEAKAKGISVPGEEMDKTLQAAVTAGEAAKEDKSKKLARQSELETAIKGSDTWIGAIKNISVGNMVDDSDELYGLNLGIEAADQTIGMGQRAGEKLKDYQKRRSLQQNLFGEAASKRAAAAKLNQELGVTADINSATDSTEAQVTKLNNLAQAEKALADVQAEATRTKSKLAEDIEAKKDAAAQLELQVLNGLLGRIKTLELIVANLRNHP